MGPGKAIAVVDLAAGRVLARFALSVEPHGVAISRRGERLFAADLIKGDALEVVQVTTGAVERRLSVGKGSHHLTLSADGRWLLVTLTATGQVILVNDMGTLYHFHGDRGRLSTEWGGFATGR